MNDTQQQYSLDEALEAAEVVTSTMGEIRDADMARQIANAQRNPRVLSRFRSRLLEMCTLSEEVAGTCTYSLPRGGKRIVGPSIRFAELIVASYDNIRVGATIVSVDDDAAVVHGYVDDLERNTRTELPKRQRVTKKRNATKADDDMKNLAVAVAKSIALRNAIFSAVPRALWEDIWHKSQEAATGKGTMKQRRESAMALYAKYGATDEQVLKALGRATIDDVTDTDLLHLRGMVTAIRGGELSVEDALRPPEEDKPTGGTTRPSVAAEKIIKAAERKRKPLEPDPPHDPSTGEVHEPAPAELPDEFA